MQNAKKEGEKEEYDKRKQYKAMKRWVAIIEKAFQRLSKKRLGREDKKKCTRTGENKKIETINKKYKKFR